MCYLKKRRLIFKMNERRVDEYCSLQDVIVVKDYDYVLNSASVVSNTNKFYICQMLVKTGLTSTYYIYETF